MAYNKAKEEHKWKKWKEREEQKLRELGMDEASIRILRESDWADFNSDRRFREHQISLLEYMEILLEETDTSEPDIQNVDDLLDMIGDEQLLHTLLETDRKTLQVLVLKMMGYSVADIAVKLGITDRAVYCRIDRLKKKIKKIS
jgi:RNA polymerase sigma-70 factor (ECF subfamily)